MNHTPQIKKAIQFAARKHQGQFRREKEPLPYITHLFSVALLVAESGADDEVVTAALLHDTLEDTDTTREEIVGAFNERVATLVELTSDHVGREGKRIDWKERKSGYITKLETAPLEALLITLADKVDNIESKLEAFAQGDDVFAQGGQPRSEYFWYQGEVLRIAQANLPEHPLTKRLGEVSAKERAVFVE